MSPRHRESHRRGSPALPAEAVHAVTEGYQEPLPHRKLQVFCVRDDQHVRAGQRGAEVVQVDPGVVGHQADADIGESVAVLPGWGGGGCTSEVKEQPLIRRKKSARVAGKHVSPLRRSQQIKELLC